MNALAMTHPPFSSAEFHRMADKGAFSGFRVELRRGMILKMSPQYYAHGAVQGDLVRRIVQTLQGLGLSWQMQVGTTIGFGDGFEPMPDIVIIDPLLVPADAGPIPPEAVKLVIEVSDSTLAHDMGEKREDYARGGLAEYWVADVTARTIVRHTKPVNGVFSVKEAPVSLAHPVAMLSRPDFIVGS